MATCNPQSLLESGKCLQCLTKKELQIVIAQLLCEITSGGSSGGALQQVFSGNYADAAPCITPTTAQAIGIDTSTGAVWYWYSGAWH